MRVPRYLTVQIMRVVKDGRRADKRQMQRIGGARYQTNWQSRVIVRKGCVEPGKITEIMKNGICMQFSESLEVGKKLASSFSFITTVEIGVFER